MARHAPHHAPSRARRSFSDRRVRLGAALGLIVGLVVAVVTATDVAASWTDRVIGGSRFTTTVFGFESSVNGGGAWANHPEGSPAVLALSTGSTSLIPGASVVGAISLRSIIGSPVVAITIDGTTPAGGLGSALRYAVVRSATCTTASFGAGASFVVGTSAAGVSLSADSVTGAVTLPAGTTTAAGTAVPLCFLLTLPDTLETWTTPIPTPRTLSATWTFSGTG